MENNDIIIWKRNFKIIFDLGAHDQTDLKPSDLAFPQQYEINSFLMDIIFKYLSIMIPTIQSNEIKINPGDIDRFGIYNRNPTRMIN